MLRMGVLGNADRTQILDNHQEAGTLFGMVKAAETYILNNTRREFIIDGASLHREERPEVPLSAIREALYNAFCHRRYEDSAAVQIDVFWDAVDIYNPGSFPAGCVPEDYLSGAQTASKPRNQLIASTLYRSGDIETYGTGLRRIRRVCDEQNVPVEVFQRGGSVHVRFTRAEAVVADNPPTTRRWREAHPLPLRLLGLQRMHGARCLKMSEPSARICAKMAPLQFRACQTSLIFRSERCATLCAASWRGTSWRRRVRTEMDDTS